MAQQTTTAQIIEDCAGAYYPWFETVQVRGSRLYVKIDAEYVEEGGDEVTRSEAVLTAEELREAAKALRDRSLDYPDRFYRDILARRWDDVDGDQPAVDSLIQQAMWGKVVFG